MEKFDLIIIGGGAGAFAAAIKANELGAKTLMVNHGLPLGGTCVNVGCVPSKKLLWAGEVMHQAKHHGIPGIDIEVKGFDFQKVVQDELDLVEKLRKEKYEKVLKHLEHVTHVEGRAEFVSKNEVEIVLIKSNHHRHSGNSERSVEASRISNGDKRFWTSSPRCSFGEAGQNDEIEMTFQTGSKPQKVQSKKFIIAAGSTATVPPIENIREVGFITHIEALKLEQQPKELTVIGAGPVGLEFAQMYSRFGTKVTILHRGSSIFRGEEELITRLTEILTNEGITIKTNVQVKSTRKEGGKKVVSYIIDGKKEEVSGDEILLATGKTPNTQKLGLDKAGVDVDPSTHSASSGQDGSGQAIKVNPQFQTSQPHIFAVGDVTNAPLRLEPTAGREGTLAAENALNGTKNSIDYDAVPWTIFTDPQLAGVGLTEDEQMKRLKVCACRTVSFSDIPKAMTMRRTEGLIKMAIHPETKQIMGVHILAPNASELIAEAMVLIKNKNTIDDVVNSLPMFPTLSESIKIAALSFTKDISKLSCCI